MTPRIIKIIIIIFFIILIIIILASTARTTTIRLQLLLYCASCISYILLCGNLPWLLLSSLVTHSYPLFVHLSLLSRDARPATHYCSFLFSLCRLLFILFHTLNHLISFSCVIFFTLFLVSVNVSNPLRYNRESDSSTNSSLHLLCVTAPDKANILYLHLLYLS